LAAAVDLDAPVSFVIVGRGAKQNEILGAASIPVRSVKEARAAGGGKERDLGAGVIQLGPNGASEGTCLLAATKGDAGRMVCAQSEGEAAALAPQLLKAAPPPADEVVRARVQASAVRDLLTSVVRAKAAELGREVGTDSELGRIFNEGLDALVGEALAQVDDLEAVSVSLAREAGGGRTGKLSVSFRSHKSWLASVIAETPDPPVTAAFGALPTDRGFAASYAWPKRERLAGPVEKSRDITFRFLDALGMSATPADRKRIADVVTIFNSFGSPIVTSQGYDPPRDVAKMTAQQRFNEAFWLSQGWSIGWMPGEPDVGMRPFLALVELANLESVKRMLGSGAGGSGFAIKTLAGPRELGPGAREIVVDIQKPADLKTGKRIKSQLFLFLMPGHGGVWNAYGVERPRILGLLKDIRAAEAGKKATPPRAGAPAPGSKPGLVLQSSVRYLVLDFAFGPESDAETQLERALGAWRLVEKLPHKGASDVLVRGETTTAPLTVTYAITFPKEAVEDLAAAARLFAAEPAASTTLEGPVAKPPVR
jgi:hypothetical protein